MIALLVRLLRKAIRIEAALIQLVHRSKFIMATLQEVQAQIQKLKDDVATEASQASAALKDLSDQVQALKDQIAAGAGVTTADLDGLITAIQGVDTAVQDIVPPGANPPAP